VPREPIAPDLSSPTTLRDELVDALPLFARCSSEAGGLLVLVHCRPRIGADETLALRRQPELGPHHPTPEIPLARRRNARPRGVGKRGGGYAAAAAALVPRWRAYMSSTHLNPGRSLSESRNRRNWAVRSSG